MPDKIISGNSSVCCTAQNIHSCLRTATASAYDSDPSPTPKTASTTRPASTPSASTGSPNGNITATMTTACPVSGTISFNARPTSSDERGSGVTSIRSCAPVCSSNSRLAPVVEVPNSAVMTRIAGTNQPHTSPPIAAPTEPASSGPNSARNTSGWIIPKISENGSCSTGRSSRSITMPTSRARFDGRGGATGAVSVAVMPQSFPRWPSRGGYGR